MKRTPSERELSVLELMADGLSNEEIGAILGIHVTTVKVHVRRIASKLDVSGRASSRTASVCQALRKGWIR